jgi:hypothetical protein
MTGKLIGVSGAFIKKLKEDYRCNIVLKVGTNTNTK